MIQPREVVKVVASQKGNPKICARGYLMVKEKSRDNKFYWCCEERKSLLCKGRATTIFENGQHLLGKISEHKHAPKPTRIVVSQAMTVLKERARNTDDTPGLIIRHSVTNVPNTVFPSLPSNDALRRRIRRARKEENTTNTGAGGGGKRCGNRAQRG